MLQLIAPHHCFGCDVIGSCLCLYCKEDIIDASSDACIVCLTPAAHGICSGCETTYCKAWWVGERSDTLERLVNAYKFQRVVSGADALCDLLDHRIPQLPPNCVVVPVPTLPSHVRQRGYDHANLIARGFSKRRGLAIKTLLRRNGTAVQRGATKRQRFIQASKAFDPLQPLDESLIYLVIDDVVTSNATLRYAADALLRGGATQVWVAAVARQPISE